MNRHHYPSNNAVLGAPQGMPIEQCSALPVTRLQYECGTRGVASFWMPTPEELKRLQAGLAVRLVVLGDTHPPVHIAVDGDGLI
jgi:hypothetical protein